MRCNDLLCDNVSPVSTSCSTSADFYISLYERMIFDLLLQLVKKCHINVMYQVAKLFMTPKIKTPRIEKGNSGNKNIFYILNLSSFLLFCDNCCILANVWKINFINECIGMWSFFFVF